MSLYGAVFMFYGNAWEVAHMLVGTCELVEEGCLSAVLVASQGKCQSLT